MNCNGVKVHDFTVSSPGNSPNTDGIQVHRSRDVEIYSSNLACGKWSSPGNSDPADVGRLNVLGLAGRSLSFWEAGTGIKWTPSDLHHMQSDPLRRWLYDLVSHVILTAMGIWVQSNSCDPFGYAGLLKHRIALCSWHIHSTTSFQIFVLYSSITHISAGPN